MIKLTDVQLMQLVRSDPQTGLAQLQTRYGGLIGGIVGCVLPGAPQDAEECEADVLFAVWKNAAVLACGQYPLCAWLVVTARNLAITRYRSLRRDRSVPWPEGFDPADAELLAPHTTEAEDKIAELVAALPQPDREIVLRRYYYLQTGGEIAKALGMAEHTVNVRLSRRREKLKQQLLLELEQEREERCYGG